MHIERIVYPKLGIIDEIEVEDDEDVEEISEETKLMMRWNDFLKLNEGIILFFHNKILIKRGVNVV